MTRRDVPDPYQVWPLKVRPVHPPDRCHLVRSPNPIARLIAATAEADIALPADLVDEYARVRALATAGTKGPDSAYRSMINKVAGGDLAIDKLLNAAANGYEAPAAARARRRARREAAETAWDPMAAAFLEHAPKVLEHARTLLAEVIAEQSLDVRFTRPDLAERYERLHDVGTALEPFTGTVQAPSFWRRFADPVAYFEGWQYPEAERLHASRRIRPDKLPAEITHMGHGVNCWRIGGAGNPDLATIAEHADEWLPDIRTADQIVTHANALVAEFYRGGPPVLPPPRFNPPMPLLQDGSRTLA